MSTSVPAPDPTAIFNLASALANYSDPSVKPLTESAAWRAASDVLVARQAAETIVARLTRFLDDTAPPVPGFSPDPFLIITAVRLFGEPATGIATVADVELFAARAAVRIDTAMGVS